MLLRIAGFGAFIAALACTGAGTDGALAPGDKGQDAVVDGAPALDPEPDVEDPDESGSSGKTRVFALHPTSEGCEWKVWNVQGKSHRLGSSPKCPHEILWNPDGSEVIYTNGDGTFLAPWRRKGKPEKIAPPPWPKQGWHHPWVAKETGKLRMVAEIGAEVVERDGKVLFEAGELSIPVQKDADGWVKYGVRGAEVVAPGQGDREESLPPWGMDVIVIFFERGEDGKWKQIAALPSRGDAGDTPGIAVGRSLLEKSWLSLGSLYRHPAVAKDRSADMAVREDLKKLLDIGEFEEVAYVQGDAGAVLFKVSWGDSPHPVPPVFSCPDLECKAPVALKGLERENTLEVQIRGEFILVAEEGSGAHPRIYTQGKDTPLLELKDAVWSSWVPENGLPKPPKG